MSHNSVYYLKKLSKKPPPGCSKLENFGFGKQVIQEECSPAKISLPSMSDSHSEPSNICSADSENQCINDQCSDKPHTQTTTDDCMSPGAQQSPCKPPTQTTADDCMSPGTQESRSTDSVLHKEAEPSSKSQSDYPTFKFDGRKFVSLKWEQMFNWLYYSNVKGGFLCKICELFAFDKQGETEYIDIGVKLGDHACRKLSKHAESKRHINAVMRYTTFTSNVNVYKQVKSQKQTEIDRNREVIKKLHRCLYFLVRQKWAVTENFEAFVRFVADLGVEDLAWHLESPPSDDTSQSERVTYLSSKSVGQMIENFGDVLERHCLASLGNNKFALLADESTDKANRSQLAIYCRWNDNGTVSDHFMGLIEMGRTRAEDFMRAIQTFFVAKGVDIRNVRFMGFDGCATMSGTHKGLQRRMTNASPYAVYINCRNHRLALCLKHLTKTYPLLCDVDNTLMSLYNLFEYSPQKMSVFLSMQEVYGQRPLVLVKASMTRWLSHLHASVRFIDRYEALLDTLDSLYAESKQPEVFGIRHFTTRRDVVAMILLLCDVLRPVNFLSLYLQEDQVNFTHLDSRVKQTLDDLHQLVAKYQAANYADTDFSKCPDIFGIIDDRTDLAQRRRNAVDVNYTPAEFLQTVGVPFIYGLIAEIEDAFHTIPLINAFGVLDPRNLPDDISDLADYGHFAIKKLSEVYGKPAEDTFDGHHTLVPSDFDSQQSVETELKSFMRQLFMLKQRGCVSVTNVQKEMENDAVMRGCFPRVYQLVIYSLLIPASTAVVERGFSLMNDVCTPLRSRLTQTNLTCLMRIISEGPDVLSDQLLEELVDKFKTQKKRKLLL